MAYPSRTLRAGSVFWSVYPIRYSAIGFNSNLLSDPDDREKGARFSPFNDVSGRRIATKYLGDHPNVAFAETIMRDEGQVTILTTDVTTTHALAQIKLVDDTVVSDFTVSAIGQDLAFSLQQGRESYPQLRTIAATLHDKFPERRGLLWDSKQIGVAGMNCLVLFGEHNSRNNTGLKLLAEMPLDRDEGLARLQAAARANGFTLAASGTGHSTGPLL